MITDDDRCSSTDLGAVGAWLWVVHILLPALAAWSLAWAVAPARPPRGLAALVLFGAVLSAYLGDRLRDRRLAWPRRWRRIGWLLAGGCALLSAGAMLVGRGWSGVEWLLPPVAVVAVYPWLGRVPLVKNLAVAGCWWWAGTMLVSADWSRAASPAALTLGLLVFVGAGLCDVKDVASDRRRGIRSAVALWGVGGGMAFFIAVLLLTGGWLIGADLPVGWWLPWTGLLLLAGRPAWLARPLVGAISVDAVLALSGPAVVTGLFW